MSWTIEIHLLPFPLRLKFFQCTKVSGGQRILKFLIIGCQVSFPFQAVIRASVNNCELLGSPRLATLAVAKSYQIKDNKKKLENEERAFDFDFESESYLTLSESRLPDLFRKPPSPVPRLGSRMAVAPPKNG
jgi:hypothetical protein